MKRSLDDGKGGGMGNKSEGLFIFIFSFAAGRGSLCCLSFPGELSVEGCG